MFTGKGSFFNDPFAIGKYALDNYPDECKNVVRNADDVAVQRFFPGLRCDTEQTGGYIGFEDDIDWLYQPGDDPEWVYAFNRMAFWITLGQAYAITADEKYARAFASQLYHWVGSVPQTSEKAWRSIEVGLRLNHWLKAVRYFESSPSMTDEVAGIFYRSVTEHAEFLMGLWNPYNLMSNWGVLANHGLFMAGAMLPKTARTDAYTAEAARRLSLEMKMQVYRDGTHWEQSPMYHNEVLRCYLDVLTLAGRNGIVIPENIGRQTRDMCYFSMYSAKPDHHLICMGDSDDADQRGLLTRGAALFSDETLKSRAYDSPDFVSLWDMGEEGIGAYRNLAASQPGQTDKAFHDSNNFYFRSGWDDEATFVHFQCGTLGAGHGHSDKLHTDLFSRGEDILTDAGRYTYVFGEDRIRYKETRAHNTLTADGKDIYICKDSWECSGLTRGVNQKFFSDTRYGYCEGGHLAFIDRGIYVNRRIIFLKPDIVLLADEMYAKGKHSYNQFFHFGSAGALEGGDGRYIYKSSRVTAEVAIIAEGLSGAVSESRISKQYNKEISGSMLTTSLTGEGFAGVFTVFAVSDANRERGLKIDKVHVKSTFKGITFADSQVEALNITFGEVRYTVVVAHEEYASPTDTFDADGCIGFGNCVVFDRAAGETETGTVLLW